MRDTLEIYVQPGTRGFHAGARGHSHVWAANPDDEATAAWRCALRRWFPKRANGVLLFREVQAIELTKTADRVYRAKLNIPDKQLPQFTFARDFTPELNLTPSRKRTKKRRGGK